MTLDYFYGNQSEMFTFYRIPKLLFTDPELKNISTETKVLYGLLLDRMSLSIKNNWTDDQSRVFIIFTIDEIMEALACAEQKAAKLLNELGKRRRANRAQASGAWQTEPDLCEELCG